MFSKITQPTLKNFQSNYLPYDAKSVICGGSENPCHSKHRYRASVTGLETPVIEVLSVLRCAK